MLDIQNKCPDHSCRCGSSTLTMSKMELFVTLVKCPVINYSTESFVLDVTRILQSCIINATNSIGGSTILYSSIVPFGIKYNSYIRFPASK